MPRPKLPQVETYACSIPCCRALRMVAARVGHPVAFTVMIGEDVPVAVPTIDWVCCRL